MVNAFEFIFGSLLGSGLSGEVLMEILTLKAYAELTRTYARSHFNTFGKASEAEIRLRDVLRGPYADPL